MDWTNINLTKKKHNANVEKFLTDINMGDEILKIDNSQLKNSLLDCLVKHLRSRPIQTRAYQLLHDLVINTQEVDLFVEEDLVRTFTLINSSLKVWEGNEYVSAACFEFLGALYAKYVTRNFSDYSELLLQSAFAFLERLRKSKAVVKAIISFLEKFFDKSGDSVIQLSISAAFLPLVVDLLSQYGMDSAVAYGCCQVILRLTQRRDENVAASSYKITVVALSTLSSNHHNAKFVGLVLCILKEVIREEKHIEYLLGDEEEEFLYICRSLSELQEIKHIDAITAALEIIQRVVRSLFLRSLAESQRLIQSIADAIKTSRLHHSNCDGSCLQRINVDNTEVAAECSMSESHIRLSDTIEQMFKTLKGYDSYINQQLLADDEETFTQSAKIIDVKLISASGLMIADMEDECDVNVSLSLEGQSATAKTTQNDPNPRFNQVFPLQWSGSEALHIEVKACGSTGYSDIDLEELNLSVSNFINIDVPLENLEHARIHIGVKIQDDDRMDTLHLQQEEVSKISIEHENENTGGNKTSIDSRKGELTEPVNEAQHLNKDDDTVPHQLSNMSSQRSPQSEVDDEVIGYSGSGNNSGSQMIGTASCNPKQALSPSYTSKAENDDVMMVMIRALQDEVEDWKQKYAELKITHETLVKATEDTYNRSLSPEDIQFKSFEGMQKSSSDISPIKHDTMVSPDITSTDDVVDVGETLNDTLIQSSTVGDHVEMDESNADDDVEIEDGHSTNLSEAFTSPVAARREGSDYKASITGINSAFSFCMSPADGLHVDINELMRGDLRKNIDSDIALDLYESLKWLFKHLRSIQSTNFEKMVLQMALPRSLLRKFVLDDFLQLLHPRRFQLRDLDIILHNVPTKLKFPDFVFVLVASASKRFAVKHNLSVVKSSVLSRLNAVVKAYMEEYQGVSQESSIFEHDEDIDDQKQSVSLSIEPAAVTIPSNLKEFGIKSLRKQDHVLKQIYFLYAGERRDKRINFESMLMFAKDFNICPGLISNAECFEMFEEVLKSNGKSFVLSKQPAINYHEFLCMLLEIAIVSNCFGEEDQLFQLTSQDNIWKKVLNFLWFLESSKGRSHIREKIILPNFKLDRKLFIVQDRLTDRKESTNLKLSILKFKY